MKIRNVNTQDAPTLRKLASLCPPLDLHTPYTYWLLTFMYSDTCFILEIDDKPVGFITSVYSKKSLFIWQIGILPEYRHQGLSSALLKQVFTKADGLGISKVNVSITEDNQASNKSFETFCKKNGFFMETVGIAEVTDLIIPEFKETEVVFEISLK